MLLSWPARPVVSPFGRVAVAAQATPSGAVAVPWWPFCHRCRDSSRSQGGEKVLY